jgi:SH3-like domain-containing protein
MLRSAMAMILLCASGVAAADGAQRWVVGSYVNIRAQAAKDAEVVDHLVANTPVTLLNSNADFCEISWGNNQQGFIACKLLGEQALNLAEIGT